MHTPTLLFFFFHFFGFFHLSIETFVPDVLLKPLLSSSQMVNLDQRPGLQFLPVHQRIEVESCNSPLSSIISASRRSSMQFVLDVLLHALLQASQNQPNLVFIVREGPNPQ